MARIRTIKPDFWSDEKIVELTPWARLLFIGLWNFADDYGRMPFSPKKIKMLVFPGDDVDVPSCLEELSREDLIRTYEREGGRYLAIRNFQTHQKIDRKTESRIPPPVEDSPSISDRRTDGDPSKSRHDLATSALRELDESSTNPRREIDETKATTQRSSAEPSTAEGNGTEEIKESNGISAPSPAPARAVDPRYQRFVTLIHDRYKTVNKTDCPWSSKDGKQAKDLLSSLDPRDWSIANLDRAIQFKLMSFDRSASEAPHRWLADLAKYFEAPLDRYGRPDFEQRDRWIRKQEQPAPPKARTETIRSFHPDADIQMFIEKLPGDPWTLLTDKIRPTVDRTTFETWFKPTRFGGIDARMLVVRVPTPDFAQIGERYGGKLLAISEELKFPFTDIEFWSEP